MIIIFCIPLLLEVFFFNYRFWESLFYNKIGNYTISVEDGRIFINDINAKVSNIYIEPTDDLDVVTLAVTVSDESNTDLTFSYTEVVNSIPESRYVRIHPDGIVRSANISFNPYTDGKHDYDLSHFNVSLNAVRPFSFRVVRFVLLIISAFLIAVFRPGSEIYKISIVNKDKPLELTHKMIIMLTCLGMITLWSAVLMKYKDLPLAEYREHAHVEVVYSMQAEALLAGHTYLNVEPPDYMAELDNPYDPYQRAQMVEKTGENCKSDLVYYNGKYYCYYGIVPTLLFYLPYMAVTGDILPNSIPILILSILFITAVFRIVYQISKRYEGTTLGHYLLMSIACVFASFVFYCVQTPWIYSVPIISALAFGSWGISFWLNAADMLADKDHASRKIRIILDLIIGSLMISLTFGSRPALAVLMFLAFPIFGRAIADRQFFSRKGIVNTLAVIVPIAVLCSLVLFYNYIRFDSFLDFGVTRNLSIGMSHHKINPDMLPFGIFEYLFQPIVMKGTYPYLHSVYDFTYYTTDYLGVIFFDPIFGGIFMLAPVSIFALLFFRRRKSLKEHGLFSLCVVAFVMAVVIMCVDMLRAGLSQRYQMDFAFLFALVAVITVIDMLSGSQKDGQKAGLYKAVHISSIVLTLVTVLVMLMLWLPLEKPNPAIRYSSDVYYSLKYLFFVLR